MNAQDRDRHLERAMVEYARRRDEAAAARRAADKAVDSATSPRQVVQVGVDGLGRLVELRFPTQAYKTMPAPELAKVILATAAEARTRAEERTVSVLAPSLPAHVDVVRLVRGDLDPQELLPPGNYDTRGANDPWNLEDDDE